MKTFTQRRRDAEEHQYIRYQNAPRNTNGIKYLLLDRINYFSKRYSKWITCEQGMPSDGATGAKDLRNSRGFWIHDKLTRRGTFDDGSPCTAWQASRILSDILKTEGRWFRSRSWLGATFLFGGWKLKRLNGWVRLKNNTPFRKNK